MPRNTKIAAFFMALALITGASLAIAFPFWLSQPTRGNANDPMSPIHYQALTAVAVMTSTPKQSSTASPTDTPQESPTITYSSSPTATPTVTSSFTAAAGTATFTPTPTQTQTAGPGPNLGDFEGSANSNWANDDWGQSIVVGADTADGTTISTPGGTSLGTTGWAGGDQTCGTGYEGPSASGSCSGCISGTMAKQVGTSVYPYAYMAMDLTPSGESGGAGVPLSTILTYDANQGITFDYKGTAGVSYVVQMITVGAAGCGNFYQYAFSPAVSNTWYTVTVYFPNVSTSGVIFSQPNYGCTGSGATDPWGSGTQVGAVQFKAEGTNTSSTEPYTLCVDNISFTVPTAPAVSGPGANLGDFEGTANNNWANDDWGQSIVVGADTADGTTISTPGGTSLGTSGWAGGDQTCGTGYEGPSASGSCSGCISGTMAKQGTGIYPYAYMALQLTPTGESGGAGVPVSTILTYDSNQGVTFDYKGTAGVSYVVQMVTVGAAGCGNFYQYAFSPSVSNTWNTVTVYFPNVSTSGAIFSQPNYGCTGSGATDPWGSGTLVGAVQFKAEGTNTSSTEPYALCVDNISFTVAAAPAPAGPGANLGNFEGTSNNNWADDDWGQSIVVGADTADGTTITNPGGTSLAGGWVSGDQTCGTGYEGPSASGSCSGCISGTMAKQVGTSVYPYAYMALQLTPTGESGAAGVPLSTILTYDANQGVTFDYEGTTGVTYVVQMVTVGAAGCGNFYQYEFSPAVSNTWYTLTVYFPGVSTNYPIFSQPNYGCTGSGATDPWGSGTQVGAVQFKAEGTNTSSTEPYTLCVDNVSFTVPTPPTNPPLDGNGTGITDFEEGPFSNNVPLAPFASSGGGIYLGPPGGSGSTCTQCPWTAGSGTSSSTPGGTDGLFNGATAEYPSNFGSTHATCLEMTGSLAASGWNTLIVGLVSGTPNQNPTAYPGGITTGSGGMAPNSRVVFNYAYGAASVGQPIMVQIITSNVTDYYYWEYTFTGSSDTNWHTMSIYFPGSPYQPQFALPPWATAPLPTWSTSTIGGVEVGPANPASAENYDMFFDNFEFD